MKKNFMYSSLLAVFALFAAACSSDTDHTLDGIPGTYDGRNLAVTVNGTLIDNTNASVTVSGDDRDAMTLVINNAILGQASYTIPDVQFRVDEYDARIFAGNGSTDCNVVKVTGKISSEKMTLAVTQEGVTGKYSPQDGASTLSVNGLPVSQSATVEMQGTKTSDMKMVLKNIVLGADEFTIPSLTITPATQSTPGTKDAIDGMVAFNFSGTAKDSYREVTVSGRIDGQGMSAEVISKNLGDLVGKWKIAVDPQMQVPTIMMELQGVDNVKFGDGDDEDITMDAQEFVTTIRGLVGMLAAQYLEALQYIDFQQDGNIALLVHDPENEGAVIEIPNEMIPKGAIRWHMDAGKVVFVVDAEMINMIPGGYGDILTGFFTVKNGAMYVPLNFKKTATGAAVYLDRTFMKQAIPAVKTLLAGLELDPTIGGIIDIFVPQIETIVNESTVFNIGLDLEKTE